MPFILSITGVFKTILVLIGAIVALRFLGQLMNAKRNMAEQNEFKERKNQQEKDKEFVENNKGKISISKNTNRSAEDIDFEEV